jgi:hypothetical protein
MSLYVQKKGSEEIPEGAVRLNEDKALRYQTHIMLNWPNQSEV